MVIFISEVDIIWILTSFSDKALNALLAIPACVLIPTPTRDTFAISELIIRSLNLTSFFISPIISFTAISSSFDTVNVKSVLPSTLTFCTITSTSMSLSLIGPMILKAVPGVSPTP